MEWFRKLFKKKEHDIEQFNQSDLSLRVAEIQSRIATLRRSIEGPAKSYKNIAPTQQLSQAGRVHTPDTSGHNERAAKDAEMMALKAKLLGKKT